MLPDSPVRRAPTDLALLVDKRANLFVRAPNVAGVFLFHDAKSGKRGEARGSMGSKEKTIARKGADPDSHNSDEAEAGAAQRLESVAAKPGPSIREDEYVYRLKCRFMPAARTLSLRAFAVL